MITKNRLEELIKEGATIYNVDYNSNSVEPINLLFTTIDGNTRHIKGEEDGTIFETRKQAEWALKYHATRIEYLDLPTWEEFITEDKYNCYGILIFIFNNYRLIAKLPDEDNDTEFIGIEGGNTELYHWDKATEENYIKACNLCVKLFKGESDESVGNKK